MIGNVKTIMGLDGLKNRGLVPQRPKQPHYTDVERAYETDSSFSVHGNNLILP